MRAVLQRVTRAEVSVNGDSIGAIANGLLVFAAVSKDDDLDDAAYLARKIAHIRIFECKGLMTDSVINTDGAILLISQFTLLADTRKGRRPSFASAANPEKAECLIEEVRDHLESSGVKVETGQFGAHMRVDSLNDGPVTIILDSADRKLPRRRTET